MPRFLKFWVGFSWIVIIMAIFGITDEVNLLRCYKLKGVFAFLYNEIWLLLYTAATYGIVKRFDWARRMSLYMSISGVLTFYVVMWKDLGEQNGEYYKWFYKEILEMDKTSNVSYLTLFYYMRVEIFTFLFLAYVCIYFSRKSSWFNK